MKKPGKTLRSILQVGLLLLVICFLSAKTYPSTNKTQTYVSKIGLPFREARSVSSLQSEYSGLLFAQQMENSIRVKQVDSIKLKDPKMAVFYAIIPGVVVHGSGHFYAGRTKTGLLLLETEVAGTGLVFLAGLAGFAESEGGESSIDPELWGFAGLLLFVGSWVYDVVMSPIAVKKENQKLLGKKSANLKFEFDHKYDAIKVVLVRQF
jgi:hypothetical protein